LACLSIPERGLGNRLTAELRPMTRIQAVDVVRPLLARMLGLAALRIRLAGRLAARKVPADFPRGHSRLGPLHVGE